MASWEEGFGGRCTAEDDVCGAYILLQEACVIAVIRRKDACVEFWARHEFCDGVVAGLHEAQDHLLGSCEIAVDDVEVVDFAAAEYHGDIDMPESLQAGAEDC